MKNIKLWVGILLPLIILAIPVESFGIEGLTVIEKRVIALFVFAAMFWILEPIPVYATSVLIIVLELIMVSDKGLILFRDADAANLGELISYKSIFSTFASPIILLFMGGFFLAMAATKYRLDQNLARIMLKPFGQNPKMVMMGLMIITALFSMFMSNTATTAMMLSILAPVLTYFPANDRGKIGFVLAIPVAANIGGIGTPIGTPPNAIALKYLTGEHYVSFGKWMSFGLPYAIVMLIIGWILLNVMYKTETPTIKLDIKGSFIKSTKANIVYATFVLTILLWLTDFIHGMNSYIVAMIPVGVFTATKIINKDDLKKISWDVLWLVSGGIALGLAMEQSGLALHLIESIPFENMSAILIIGLAATLTMVMANFMSNTATANLLMPIIAALGTTVESLLNIGGLTTVVIATAIAASMGMALPISTPPNALAHGTGLINTGQMARIGVIIAIIGLSLSFVVVYILKLTDF
ncbi:MAG: DASS family sodium-coupled anion symporter [Bacteroidetes bacterium]|jgi:sodium-dependent dicarboxylate transporter 2/3/5|nr:DASS family sodium-coupled anion symporter [Bacteroidota bacterium]